MESKKPLPQPSSSSEESSSNEEEGNEQNFVRSDRKTQKIEDKKAQKADEDEDEDEDDEEDDDDADAFDGTQRVNADAAVAEEDSSSETEPADGGSNSDSSTSSASEGKPSHSFVFLPPKPENANGHGKKASASEKPSKPRPKAEVSPKKRKDKASKRDRDAEPQRDRRDAEPQEKGSSKKLKKESTDKPSKSVEHLPKAKDAEKVSKEKHTPSHTSEKKNEGKKSVQATAVAEKSKNMPSQQNSSKKPENASEKKAAEKSKNDKKVPKDPEPETSKGPFSPAKPKLFTAKDEIVLTKEILNDVKQGKEIPTKKIDGYWSTMVDRVKGRMEGAWSKEQLCEKVKRMKVRYTSMAEKFKDSEERKFRNSTDKELFGLWDQIWGSGDAMKVDHDKEVAEVKDKQTKAFVAASPVKGGKMSRDKVVAPVHDVKAVHEESEARKSKHTEKQSSDEDASESEESEREGDSHKKDVTVTPMEVDQKDVVRALVPKSNAVQGHENNSHSHSISDAQKLFQEEIRATLLELQESSKQTMKEWQTKALAVVQNAVKAAADQSRLVNGIGVGGFDGLFTPFRSLDLTDSQQAEGDQALQQQWHELRLKELDVYRQKLELMQRECQLKQDQLELQLHRSK